MASRSHTVFVTSSVRACRLEARRGVELSEKPLLCVANAEKSFAPVVRCAAATLIAFAQFIFGARGEGRRPM
jgi:hypothetical protein